MIYSLYLELFYYYQVYWVDYQYKEPFYLYTCYSIQSIFLSF